MDENETLLRANVRYVYELEAQLAAASAAEVDAVQRAQEAERELETLRRDTAEVLEPFTLLEVDLGAMLHHRGVHIDAIDVARARRLYNECKETAAE